MFRPRRLVCGVGVGRAGRAGARWRRDPSHAPVLERLYRCTAYRLAGGSASSLSRARSPAARPRQPGARSAALPRVETRGSEPSIIAPMLTSEPYSHGERVLERESTKGKSQPFFIRFVNFYDLS